MAVDGCYHLKSLKREIDGDELPDDFVIIDNQHAAKSLGHGARLSAPADSCAQIGCVSGDPCS